LNIKELECNGGRWKEMAQDRVQSRILILS
jgi:hypothetical protein